MSTVFLPFTRAMLIYKNTLLAISGSLDDTKGIEASARKCEMLNVSLPDHICQVSNEFEYPTAVKFEKASAIICLGSASID